MLNLKIKTTPRPYPDCYIKVKSTENEPSRVSVDEFRRKFVENTDDVPGTQVLHTNVQKKSIWKDTTVVYVSDHLLKGATLDLFRHRVDRMNTVVVLVQVIEDIGVPYKVAQRMLRATHGRLTMNIVRGLIAKADEYVAEEWMMLSQLSNELWHAVQIVDEYDAWENEYDVAEPNIDRNQATLDALSGLLDRLYLSRIDSCSGNEKEKMLPYLETAKQEARLGNLDPCELATIRAYVGWLLDGDTPDRARYLLSRLQQLNTKTLENRISSGTNALADVHAETKTLIYIMNVLFIRLSFFRDLSPELVEFVDRGKAFAIEYCNAIPKDRLMTTAKDVLARIRKFRIAAHFVESEACRPVIKASRLSQRNDQVSDLTLDRLLSDLELFPKTVTQALDNNIARWVRNIKQLETSGMIGANKAYTDRLGILKEMARVIKDIIEHLKVVPHVKLEDFDIDKDAKVSASGRLIESAQNDTIGQERMCLEFAVAAAQMFLDKLPIECEDDASNLVSWVERNTADLFVSDLIINLTKARNIAELLAVLDDPLKILGNQVRRRSSENLGSLALENGEPSNHYKVPASRLFGNESYERV